MTLASLPVLALYEIPATYSRQACATVLFARNTPPTSNVSAPAKSSVPATATYFTPASYAPGYASFVSASELPLAASLIAHSSSPGRVSKTRPNGYASALECGLPSVINARTYLAPPYGARPQYETLEPIHSLDNHPPALCATSTTTRSRSPAVHRAVASNLFSKLSNAPPASVGHQSDARNGTTVVDAYPRSMSARARSS
mmetsp:Transcript_4219/g.15463  ORF Transcript_4219/g.15463 Transcript_4219/m.15463 type:complete len:201 (-) Transcript_4219:192-794(-)